jgi:hypothetical protein
MRGLLSNSSKKIEDNENEYRKIKQIKGERGG